MYETARAHWASWICVLFAIVLSLVRAYMLFISPSSLLIAQQSAVYMHNFTPRLQSIFESTIAEVRDRLRSIRKGLNTPFRKAQKFTIETITSPASHQHQQRRLTSTPLEGSIPSSTPPPTLNLAASSLTMDGSGERRSVRMRAQAPVSAIFVHAGAGYHSQTNEHIHLAACNE